MGANLFGVFPVQALKLAGNDLFRDLLADKDGNVSFISAILAGAGVIENDFHPYHEFCPNLCALYVQKKYRNQKLATHLIQFIIKDMQQKGIKQLFLLTNHTSFYEKLNWKYITTIEDNEKQSMRVYQYILN